MKGLTGILLLALLQTAAPAQLQPTFLPTFNVGWRILTLSNATPNGSPAIPVRVWYPAIYTGIEAPVLAPPPAGHPTIVFLHGKCATAGMYLWLSYALSSQGWVVVLKDSAGCSEDVQFVDGIALYHTLVAESQTPGSFFNGTIDVDAVGICGHSMGAGNVGRILANNPGYKAGISYGIWTGPGQSNWNIVNAPLIHDPLVLVHGIADTAAPYATDALGWWNLMTAGTGIHILYAFGPGASHFNLCLPDWPDNDPAFAWPIFLRTMELTDAFFRRFLNDDASALEYVVGNAARNDPLGNDILVKVGEPQVWSDVPPATGQVHCISTLSAPGFAGIYVSLLPANILTPIGDLLIDPFSATTLAQGAPNADDLLSVCFPMPPGFVGVSFIHQALGTTDAGALHLSNAAAYTVTN